MTTWNTAAADAMLKQVFQDPLFDGVVLHSKVLDLFQQNSNVKEGPQGRYVELAHMFGYNEGIGARNEDGFLPIPGNPTFVNGRVYLKKNLAVAQMTRNVMANAVKSKAAFADWAEIELTKTERGLQADLDRQAIGFGAGIICRIDDAAPDATVGIDAPYGLAGNVKGWAPGIRRGMTIVAGPNADGSSLRSNGQSAMVLSLNKAGNAGGGIVTFDRDVSAIGWAQNDYLFRGDDLGNNAPVNGVEVEMMGLAGLVDDGTILDTLQNISRTDYDEWKAQYVDADAAPYSGAAAEILFLRMMDDAEELGGGMVSTFIMSNAAFRNAFVEVQKQLGYGAMTGPANQKMGTKGIQVYYGDKSVNLRAFPKMIPGRVYGLDTSTLWRYHLSGFEWDDLTGAIWKQVAVGQGIKDAWYAYGRTEMEFGCSDPQRNVFADGIDETVA
ncbi:MAG: hypothetical protein AMS20_00010 [Gemmatimonas sp. SG8_28]|nr:MAG: hypothetical protein AMS20_00010 [Gemmatimonas sp. SG8_28]